jgi:hypothetical protein
MITPVENGSTCCGPGPSEGASSAQVRRARARPSAPVPALALPVFTTNGADTLARTRCSRHTCTGAAQNRLLGEDTGHRRAVVDRHAPPDQRGSALRTPAMATPMRTPGTG